MNQNGVPKQFWSRAMGEKVGGWMSMKANLRKCA
jgi:hypothetical protein